MVDALRQADFILFAGMGSSGTLAKYGARCFSDMGKFSVGLEDTYYPVETYTYKNVAVLMLSESGGTKELVEMAQHFREKDAWS